jgi:hypothetical protein
MIDINKLIAVSVPPDNPGAWLSDTSAGVDYLLEQLRNDETIIYASLQCTLVQGILALSEKVSPPDHSDLLHATFMPDATWSITHVSGGGEPDRVYLAPPLDSPGCISLRGGENLVVRRRFQSVDKGKTRTEVSQKLVHALDLYWLDEESAFCRLDEHGDVEPVIRIIDLESRTGKDYDLVVTIKAHDLARYLVVSNMILVQKFDFTRLIPGSFVGWGNAGEYEARGPDLFYNKAAQSGASYVNGILISRPQTTLNDLIYEYQSKWDDSAKQYATFKAYDWKNARIDEISCAPSALASYFEPDSPPPFQITPAFFRPEVLQRYKADPEKYTLEHRSVYSRGGWSLKTYDINEAGQVHTYLHYLGDLPYQEQLYWQAFNEWSKGSISKRAFTTDIQGEWTEIPDPLIELISAVRKLDDSTPDWWQPRGEPLRATMHYPITTSPDEWGDSLLILDQMLVEGFATKPIRARLDAIGRAYEKDWASLRLIQELMAAQGLADGDAAGGMEPLRRLHFLRSKVKGHSADAQRQQLIKQARTDHGSLKGHFAQLAYDCQEAFGKACSALAKA